MKKGKGKDREGRKKRVKEEKKGEMRRKWEGEQLEQEKQEDKQRT